LTDIEEELYSNAAVLEPERDLEAGQLCIAK
jgi:hypothetical protein